VPAPRRAPGRPWVWRQAAVRLPLPPVDVPPRRHAAGRAANAGLLRSRAVPPADRGRRGVERSGLRPPRRDCSGTARGPAWFGRGADGRFRHRRYQGGAHHHLPGRSELEDRLGELPGVLPLQCQPPRVDQNVRRRRPERHRPTAVTDSAQPRPPGSARSLSPTGAVSLTLDSHYASGKPLGAFDRGSRPTPPPSTSSRRSRWWAVPTTPSCSANGRSPWTGRRSG